ncbi:hypothetical protein L6R50_04845 [Myxococcota bacterium]|nr:hypothetical protein [Myxococcota bacterium]
MTASVGIAKVALGAGGAVFFAALMLSTAGVALVPAAHRLAAPVVCPGGTVESVVVRRVSHPVPGETHVSGELMCLDAAGCATRAEVLPTLATLFALSTAVAIALGLLGVGLLLLRGLVAGGSAG